MSGAVYLMMQIVVFLALAAAAGFLAGWTLRGIRDRARRAAAKPAPPAAAAQPELDGVEPARPPGLEAPHGSADELQRIVDIDAQTEKRLNELGVWHFSQIAGWSPAHVAWIDERLALGGGVGRDDWVGQARAWVERC